MQEGGLVCADIKNARTALGDTYREILAFANLSLEDACRLAGVSRETTSLDAKVPLVLHWLLFDLAELERLVIECFSGDAANARRWFQLGHPAFDHVAPSRLIELGHLAKLLNFALRSSEYQGRLKSGGTKQMALERTPKLKK